MDTALFALAATALGGILVIVAVVITGYLCFRLKRDPGEPFFGPGSVKGDAFVLDELAEEAKPGRPPLHYGTMPFEPVEEDVAAQILSKQTDKFLDQLKEEGKVKDE